MMFPSQLFFQQIQNSLNAYKKKFFAITSFNLKICRVTTSNTFFFIFRLLPKMTSTKIQIDVSWLRVIAARNALFMSAKCSFCTLIKFYYIFFFFSEIEFFSKILVWNSASEQFNGNFWAVYSWLGFSFTWSFGKVSIQVERYKLSGWADPHPIIHHLESIRDKSMFWLQNPSLTDFHFRLITTKLWSSRMRNVWKSKPHFIPPNVRLEKFPNPFCHNRSASSNFRKTSLFQ